jgi:hypothetical protein
MYLHCDGGFIALAALQQWSQQHGQAREATFRLPLMSPGRYRACRLSAFPYQYPAFMAGTLPMGLCTEGTLVPGGELRLGLPAAPQVPE